MRTDKLARYLRLAQLTAALFSKDPSRQVGALLLAPHDNAILSIGYNGQPRGCDDHRPDRQARPEKYFWYEHAERNAIYNYARQGGAGLRGAWCVVTLMPCMDCARALAAVGVTRVITVTPDPAEDPQWQMHFARTLELFAELGIELVQLSDEDLRVAS